VTVKTSRMVWRIQLLGSFAVTVDGIKIEAERWRLRKAKSLVAMLALAPGQRRHREYVLDRLWPDLEPMAAARNLHQTLYVARRALAGVGPPRPGLMSIRDEQVGLDNAGPVEVDVLQFEMIAKKALATGDVAELRAASDLYAGDLLPDLPDADWLTARRDELRETHREILVKLATALQQSAPEEALIILTRALESNPVHEGAVRVQMVVLARMGRRSEALARYERLVDDLLDAFGTDPDAETVALFRELLTGSRVQERPRTADATTANEDIGYLPATLTSFVGRERELLDVERLTGHARLLTLTGAGGSGKTRLAIEAARGVRSSYPDGVWFVDLATVGESLLVVDAVAEALRLDSGQAPDPGQALVDQLHHRNLLIVLDNCEHLLAACARLVAAILTGCPGVVVLATSREPLHAHGEYTFRVPSLALPSPNWNRAPDLSQLSELPSVRLFVERAAQVRPGFALDVSNAQGVVDLCRRLDGMPLALELAAARAAVLEPAEIVHRLSDALSLLGGGPTSITRHQTLRGTLEWSHDLLTEPEQVLLRRLSVFSGSFTLEAMEAVCGAPPLERTGLFDLLVKLVEKSLVVAQKTAGGTRYRQLETVRQFGSEKLDRAGETGQLSAAHSAYFLAFAVAHNPERTMGVVIEQPKLLDREHDNLRAALRWACAHDPETALRLVASLWRFWFVRGHAVEGARWVERVLAVTAGPTRPRAAALIGLTALDSRQGRSDRHRSLGAEAMAIVRRIGEPDEVVMVVTADGQFVHASADEHPNLFWGLRGGGGNFGVVTSFEFQLHEVGPTVFSGLVFYPADEAQQVLRGYRAACAAAPDELTTLVNLTTAPPVPFLPESVHGTPIIGVGGCWSGDVDAGDAATAPFRSLGTVIADVFAPNPYAGWQQALDPLYPRGVHNYWRSALLRTTDDASLRVLMDSFAARPTGLTEIHLQHLGGAVGRVPADATAFALRDQEFMVNVCARTETAEGFADAVEWARGVTSALGPDAATYANFPGEADPARARASYPPDTYRRLVELKNDYDPTNLFRLNQNIAPSV
jgi:predicted ATPase/DNA-binding SARP family transcriptional activator